VRANKCNITLKEIYSKCFYQNGDALNCTVKWPPPSPYSISWYKYYNGTYGFMSTRLASLGPDLFQEPQEAQTEENLQQEIECPRCLDIMTLSSDFDKLLYVCQECQLSLVTK
jgi:hypothetical protein